MLKKISVSQLVIGMYIHEFCGSWMDHPFWQTSFVLEDPADLQEILDSSISEVWIDTEQGSDIPPGQIAVSQAASEAQVEAELKEIAEEGRRVEPVSITGEFARAARICLQSKRAVRSMFEESRMGIAVNVDEARELVEEISGSVLRNPNAIISLARLKTADEYTYMHSVAVCALMVALSNQLGLDKAQTQSAGLAGLLHDLGKAHIPGEILNKPGKLSHAEFDSVKHHPVKGHELLLAAGNIDPIALDVCRHHHEKLDGSGYPYGLSGDDISLFAKMAAVCDVYDAITSNRPYRQGLDPAESLRKMAEWSHGHFDSKVFHAFVKSIGIYPVGSLVLMKSGRIGVVLEQSAKSLTAPCVKVFFSTKSNMRILPEVIDLSAPGTTDLIVGREAPDKWNFPDLNELWSGSARPPW